LYLSAANINLITKIIIMPLVYPVLEVEKKSQRDGFRKEKERKVSGMALGKKKKEKSAGWL
jgi:hypothetical protein